jgi:hypothetical protein
MHKGLVVIGSVSATVAVLAIGVACGDSGDGSTFPGGDPNDSGAGSFDTGGFVVTDGNTDDGNRRPVDCNPHLPAAFTPQFKAPKTPSGACSSADLQAYFERCLDPVDVAACKTWREDPAHAACVTCIEPADHSGPIQQHADRLYSTLNIAGCISIERNETTEGTCAVAYWNAIQCTRDSCATCLTNQGADDFNEFYACQQKAEETGCAGYRSKAVGVGGACVGVSRPDAGAYDCFPHRNEDKDSNGVACEAPDGGAGVCKTHYLRLMAQFCGPI